MIIKKEHVDIVKALVLTAKRHKGVLEVVLSKIEKDKEADKEKAAELMAELKTIKIVIAAGENVHGKMYRNYRVNNQIKNKRGSLS